MNTNKETEDAFEQSVAKNRDLLQRLAGKQGMGIMPRMFSKRSIDVQCSMPLPLVDQRSNLFQLVARGPLKHLRDGVYRITEEGVFEVEEGSGWQRVPVSGKATLAQSWPKDEELGMVAGYREIKLPIRLVRGQVMTKQNEGN